MELVDYAKEKPTQYGDYYVITSTGRKRVYYWNVDQHTWFDSDSVHFPIEYQDTASYPLRRWLGSREYTEVKYWIRE